MILYLPFVTDVHVAVGLSLLVNVAKVSLSSGLILFQIFSRFQYYIQPKTTYPTIAHTSLSVCVCLCVCVSVCVKEKDREIMCVLCVCVCCVSERERERAREAVHVYVCENNVCVCERERERERDRERERRWISVCYWEQFYFIFWFSWKQETAKTHQVDLRKWTGFIFWFILNLFPSSTTDFLKIVNCKLEFAVLSNERFRNGQIFWWFICLEKMGVNVVCR